jgi:hypothetical protein
MAVTVLADVSAALSLVMRPRLQTQINSVAVLPYLLPIVPGEGKSCNWSVEFTGASNAAASAEGVARSSADADDETEVPATLAWAQYDKTSSVSDMAQAASGRNLNPESIGSIGNDLLLGRVAGQGRRIALGIASDLYAGDPTASPTELAGAAIAIDSSGTFASINPATYTEWASVESTSALAGISFSMLRDFITDIYDSCGFLPEFITCPTNVFNAIRDLYTDFEANVVREISMARGGGARGEEPRVVKLAAGMRAVEVDGVPFVLDKWATANTMYAWNTDFVEIQQLDPLQSILDKGAEGILDLFRRVADDPKVTLPREQIEGMLARGTGLRPQLKLLGDRGLSKEANISVFAQLQWKRRNAFGKHLFT